MKKASFKSLGIFAALTTGVIMSSCSTPPKEVEKLTLLKKITIDCEDTVVKFNRKQGDAHSGQFFSRADSANQYGACVIFDVADSLLQKDLRVYIDAWVRTGDLNAKHAYAVAFQDGANMLSWSEINLKGRITEPDKWVNLKDSVTIPADLVTKSGLAFRVFAFNSSQTSFLDSDDINIIFKKVEKVLVK